MDAHLESDQEEEDQQSHLGHISENGDGSSGEDVYRLFQSYVDAQGLHLKNTNILS